MIDLFRSVVDDSGILAPLLQIDDVVSHDLLCHVLCAPDSFLVLKPAGKQFERLFIARHCLLTKLLAVTIAHELGYCLVDCHKKNQHLSLTGLQSLLLLGRKPYQHPVLAAMLV